MEIYIGNNQSNKNYDKVNPPCEINGVNRFMVDHPDNYITDLKYFPYGMEVWCNMPGKYVTIVADLNNLAQNVATRDYKMSICNLGLFGTIYQQSGPIQDDHIFYKY